MEVDGGAQLFTTLALLFFGALLAGIAPFFMRIREAHLHTVAALGAGLLIGSALAVIVPEGFHAFAQVTGHDHHEYHHRHGAGHDHDHSHEHEHEHAQSSGVPEGVAGLVLVLGFLAMLLLDHAQHAAGGTCGHPGHNHGHGHSHSRSGGGAHSRHQGHTHSLDAASGARERLIEAEDKAGGKPGAASGGGGGGGGAAGREGEPAEGRDGEPPAPQLADSPGKAKAAADPSSAITGLLIHCCADGLAMGAAFLSANARLTTIIAAAMVLHKAPMAFGLATYLMACNWSFQRAHRTLVLFAATAPAATMATYGLLGSLSFLSSPTAVALCVIFSGGTFLYAATMHILPEVMGSEGGRMGGAQLAAVVAGSLLPVALSWGHHH